MFHFRQNLLGVFCAGVLAFAGQAELSGQTRNAKGAAHAAKRDDVVSMNAFEVNVNAKKYHWRYARSRHFEILSSLDELAFVAQIVRRAEQLIGLFERSSPIFRQTGEISAKVIFIKDVGVERFFTSNVKRYDPDDFDAPTFGVNGAASEEFHQVSARAESNDEQIIFLKLITKKFLEAERSSEQQKIHENAVDLAISYLQEVVAMRARVEKVQWFVDVINGFRGHTPGGWSTMRELSFSETYTFPNNRFLRPSWCSVDGANISVGRFCLACEMGNTKRMPAFDRLSARKQEEFWSRFMTHPFLGLGEVLENAAFRQRPGKRTSLDDIHRYLVLQRETRDFVYYAMFGPQVKNRLALARLILALGKEPMSEDLFKRCFGENYEEFHADIYRFFNELTRGMPNYQNSPWGPQQVSVSRSSSQAIPRLPEFRDAKPCERGRIIGDWFSLAKLEDSARRTLLAAYNEMPTDALADADFVAAMGLSELAAGTRTDARLWLENAVRANVRRPEAYRVLAQLRIEAMRQLHGENYRLDSGDVASIAELLTTAARLANQTPKTCLQCIELWNFTDEKPTAEFLQMLAEECLPFAGDVELLEQAAPFFARHGRADAVKSLLDEAAQFSFTDKEAQRLDALRTFSAR